MIEYHKIDGLYARNPETKRLMPGIYRSELVHYLANNQWQFTEKIDGTNIRVYWDGHRVSFGGRTDRADIPGRLRIRLEDLFGGEANEQMFEQLFGEKHVILFGEGYGAKIQSGGAYIPDGNDFILFDVQVLDDEEESGIFLKRYACEEIAKAFGIQMVPIIMEGTLVEAEAYIKARPDSTIGTAKMEGLVGKPVVEMMDRMGRRVIVKIKVRDYQEIESYDVR